MKATQLQESIRAILADPEGEAVKRVAASEGITLPERRQPAGPVTRFRCQECHRMVPVGRHTCANCGSGDIDIDIETGRMADARARRAIVRGRFLAAESVVEAQERELLAGLREEAGRLPEPPPEPDPDAAWDEERIRQFESELERRAEEPPFTPDPGEEMARRFEDAQVGIGVYLPGI